MTFEDVIELSKRRGFFWPSYSIYGGSSGFYDYGPLGSLMKDNIINAWKRTYAAEGAVFVDTPVISPEEVFRASGHLEKFSDIAVKCSNCKTAYKFESLLKNLDIKEIAGNTGEADSILSKYHIKCPKCGSPLTGSYNFNLMFRIENESLYLRPETAQGIFVNFKNLLNYSRSVLPLIVCQVGKGFRNEISPRQALIRMREFTQAEVEVFYDNADSFSLDSIKNGPALNLLRNNGESLNISAFEALSSSVVNSPAMAYFINKTFMFLSSIGLDPAAIRAREHSPEERAHYSSETWDFEFFMDGEWIEIVGISDRNSYDLSRHRDASGQDMSVNGSIPHVIEPSHGVDRIFLSIMNGCYYRRENGYKVLKLRPEISPVHFAVFPLQRKDGLDSRARDMFAALKAIDPFIFYDESGTIGRRYARQDEIGTPFCITVDYQTIDDGTVTVRERDSSKQKRVGFRDLLEMAGNYPESFTALFVE